MTLVWRVSALRTDSVVMSIAFVSAMVTVPSVAESVLVVAALESVAHTEVVVSAVVGMMPEVASVVPRASAIVVPGVSAAVYGPEMRPSEVEIVAVRIACIDSEVPVACIPVEWTVEIGGGAEGTVLPVEENVAKVEVAVCPIGTIEVIVGVDTHQVVQVHLIGSLVLLLREIQFIGHLVGKEQRLLACLLVAHGIGCGRQGEPCCQDDNQLLHSRMGFKCLFLIRFWSPV